MILRAVYFIMSVVIIVLVVMNLHYTDVIKELKLKNANLDFRNKKLVEDLQENIEVLQRIKDSMKF